MVPRTSGSQKVPFEPVWMRLLLFPGLARVGKRRTPGHCHPRPSAGIPFGLAQVTLLVHVYMHRLLFSEMASVSVLPYRDF